MAQWSLRKRYFLVLFRVARNWTWWFLHVKHVHCNGAAAISDWGSNNDLTTSIPEEQFMFMVFVSDPENNPGLMKRVLFLQITLQSQKKDGRDCKRKDVIGKTYRKTSQFYLFNPSFFSIRLLTGAPRDVGVGAENATRMGAMYACPLTASMDDCERVDISVEST